MMRNNPPKSLYKQEEKKKFSKMKMLANFNLTFSFNGLIIIASFLFICFFIYFKRYFMVAFIVFIVLLLAVLILILKFLVYTFMVMYRDY